MGAAEKRMIMQWVRRAEQQGWAVRMSTGGHWKWYRPDGRMVASTSSTPSDSRSLNNIRMHLRRAGLDIP